MARVTAVLRRLAVRREILAARRARNRLIPPHDSPALPPTHVLRLGARPEVDDATLVSVVLPTWNRAALTLRAIDSVRAQTWEHWELLVIDDGSTDDTVEQIRAAAGDDPRITLIGRPHEGVCAARNAGLAVATGGYLSFLDSDNRWEPGFLEAMVTTMEADGLPAAFGTLEVRRPERTFWRFAPTSRELLGVRNQIDMNVLVVRADVMNAVGGFDPTLRRAVDQDLAIRIADRVPITHVPVVGAVIDRDLTGADRISVAEADMWPNVVRLRHLIDWPAERAKDRDDELLSVVVPLGPDAADRVREVLAAFTDRRVEVVVVDCRAPLSALTRVARLAAAEPRVRVVGFPLPMPLAVSADIGFAATTGATLLILDTRVDGLPALVAGLTSADVAVPAEGPQTARAFAISAAAFGSVDGLDAMMDGEFEVLDLVARLGPDTCVSIVAEATGESRPRPLPRHDQVVAEFERRWGRSPIANSGDSPEQLG